jgi:hypothetical protein
MGPASRLLGLQALAMLGCSEVAIEFIRRRALVSTNAKLPSLPALVLALCIHCPHALTTLLARPYQVLRADSDDKSQISDQP